MTRACDQPQLDKVSLVKTNTLHLLYTFPLSRTTIPPNTTKICASEISRRPIMMCCVRRNALCLKLITPLLLDVMFGNEVTPFNPQSQLFMYPQA